MSGAHKRKEWATANEWFDQTNLYPKSTYLKYTLFGHRNVSAVHDHILYAAYCPEALL